MRRALVSIAVIATMMFAVPAAAAPPSAADFADDCNADGRIDIAGVQRYVGGSGVLAGDCSVVMEPGASLVFRSVDITGTGNLVAISSPERTTIKVINSSIVVDGFLELTAGCCAGDQLVPEYGGTIVVRNSELSGEALQLLASFDWPRGKILVSDSTLEGSGALGVQIRASDLSGKKGRVRVIASQVTSGGDILIRTGKQGRTVARGNLFDALGEVTVATGPAGRCRSIGNTPAVTCS